MRLKRKRTGDAQFTIFVESLCSSKTREPRLNVFFREESPPVQLSPSEARELALNILQGAEASEQDAFMVHWAEECGAEPKEAPALLVAFREWRKTYRKEREERTDAR